MLGKFVSGLALTAALLAATASADEPRHALPQSAGITTDLGNNTSALTYWVDEADGIHVVTTVDTVAGGDAVVKQERQPVARFSASILPGQSQLISVPVPVGSKPQVLRIRRLSNRLGDFRIEVDLISPPQV